MIGERLAEVRRDFGDNQKELAAHLHVSLATVRSWEQGKSAPSHESLVAICRRYHVSADYLLGLNDADSVYLRHKVAAQLSADELKEVREYIGYLLWKQRQQK